MRQKRPVLAMEERKSAFQEGISLEGCSWHRLKAIQAEVDKFWTSWCDLAGPNLFLRPKWHRAARNVQVGDLVWIADQNTLRGQFRLGRVVKAYPDRRRVVRDADIWTCVGLPAPLTAGSQKRRTVPVPTTILCRDRGWWYCSPWRSSRSLS